MEKKVKLPFSNPFIQVKWDSKAKVGTITTLNNEKIHFFAEDLKCMLKELERVEAKVNNRVKT